jgi:hypothetical protein
MGSAATWKSRPANKRLAKASPGSDSKWIARFEAEGVEGLRDRSLRPLSSPSQATLAVCAAVEALRRQRQTGQQIAAEVGVSAATVCRILKRLGLNRLAALEPAEPIRRYERALPRPPRASQTGSLHAGPQRHPIEP